MPSLVSVLRELQMHRLPRMFGHPKQHIVYDGKEFLNWFHMMNGRSPCFTSHNSYVEFKPDNSQSSTDGIPVKTKVDNLFFDFDSDPEEDIPFSLVGEEVQKITNYLQDCDISHSVVFSGGKGYHVYIHMKPEVRSINYKLTQDYREVAMFLKQKLSMKSMDIQCAEPKRLCRIPGSKYVKYLGERTERKCFPLSSDAEVIKDKNRMYEMSKWELPDLPYRRGSKRLGIAELKDVLGVDEYDGKEVKRSQVELDNVDYDIDFPDSNFLDLVSEFFRPCIRYHLLHDSNPDHFIRVAACMKASRLFSLEEAKELFKKISHEAEWEDRNNKRRRDYHIESIYSKDYILPSCRKLRAQGFCLGSSCEHYSGPDL